MAFQCCFSNTMGWHSKWEESVGHQPVSEDNNWGKKWFYRDYNVQLHTNTTDTATAITTKAIISATVTTTTEITAFA